MNYAPVIEHMLVIYIGLCFLAMLLAKPSDDRDSALQAFVYGLTIYMFDLAFAGKARHFGFWWYSIEGFADLYLVATAIMISARSSRWVVRFGLVALVLDLTFMVFSASGHRLPGIWYFRTSNVLESLQVLSLVFFSHPILGLWNRAGKLTRALVHELKRMLPWTHRQSLKRA